MNDHKVVSHENWITARKRLLDGLRHRKEPDAWDFHLHT